MDINNKFILETAVKKRSFYHYLVKLLCNSAPTIEMLTLFMMKMSTMCDPPLSLVELKITESTAGHKDL